MSCYNAEMKKGRKDVLAWMLCLVMIAGAVACTGEKGASGQKGAVPEVQRGKQAVTHGMHREKRCTRVNFATEEVVVENNALGLPSGLQSYGQAVASWDQYAETNGLTPEQKQAGLNKLAQGDLPAGQNAATGLITAWGAGMSAVVAPVLLPSGATAGSILAGGVISGAANVSNQITGDGPVSMTDALIAAGSGAVTQGKGFWFTEGVSVIGAYGGATLQGKDAVPAVAGAAVGTAVGAGGGKLITSGNNLYPIVSDKSANLAGAVIGSGASEVAGSEMQNQLERKK
ncbi:hypothetical protein [Erwinia amylovora]|uniref:hypothetical protein n=1 Tax=Erwinia amylovora TaxID=552 RepID=UPI001F03EA04|nr:hypothetical protein [Erwinia amylovora]